MRQTGEGALRAARSSAPDVIFLDLCLNPVVRAALDGALAREDPP